MKTLIVYFSLEGSTKAVAEQLARECGGDLLEVKTIKPYPTKGFAKYFWGGKSATFGESPALQNPKADLAQYDVIAFGTPVWAGTFAPPLRSFIKENPVTNKRIALFACSMGTAPKKAFARLKRLLGANDFFAEEWFKSPAETKSSLLEEKAKTFAQKLK